MEKHHIIKLKRRGVYDYAPQEDNTDVDFVPDTPLNIERSSRQLRTNVRRRQNVQQFIIQESATQPSIPNCPYCTQKVTHVQRLRIYCRN